MYGVSHMDVYEDIALISFRKIPASAELLADIFGRFADEDINIDMISQTSPVGDVVSLSFTCLQADMVKVLGISNQLRGKYPQMQPLVSNGNCKITLSGEEMRTASGVFARAVTALATTVVDVQQVTTSETEISLLVTAAHLQNAVAALKKCFELDMAE